MKYAPKKVFIIKDGGYQELTYEAYCALCESDSSYKDKRFIPLHGMLMEVTEDDFKEFYRNQRRQKYLEERSTIRTFPLICCQRRSFVIVMFYSTRIRMWLRKF